MSAPTALIVDDDPDFRVSLVLLVEREGFVCRSAGSLQEALASVQQALPDVVLLDVQLPDGISLELLGENELLAATQVIVVTGHASVDTAVDALKRGAADYLVKPVDRARLKACLANARRLCRALRPCLDDIPKLRDSLNIIRIADTGIADACNGKLGLLAFKVSDDTAALEPLIAFKENLRLQLVYLALDPG
jgi:DNA-binding response OmpR family regulator